jgi:hypothetical protein
MVAHSVWMSSAVQCSAVLVRVVVRCGLATDPETACVRLQLVGGRHIISPLSPRNTCTE